VGIPGEEAADEIRKDRPDIDPKDVVILKHVRREDDEDDDLLFVGWGWW